MDNILFKLADACKMQDPTATQVVPDRADPNANTPQTETMVKGVRRPINTLGKYATLFKLADQLNAEVHKEKEKRVELNSLPPECDDVKPSIIKQGILREVKDGEDVISYCRIRMKQDPGKVPKYSLGVKNFSKNEESEVEISKDTFDSFYPDNLDKPQEKKRYALKDEWTVDEIDDGKIVAEREYKNKNEVEIPESFDVVSKKESSKLALLIQKKKQPQKLNPVNHDPDAYNHGEAGSGNTITV